MLTYTISYFYYEGTHEDYKKRYENVVLMLHVPRERDMKAIETSGSSYKKLVILKSSQKLKILGSFKILKILGSSQELKISRSFKRKILDVLLINARLR